MSRGSRAGIGALQGAAGGAGLGTAIMPGVGTAIGALGGGVLGLIGGLTGSDGPSDEDIERQRDFLRRKQALEAQAYQLDDSNYYN
jgi:phage tail tape-measure protein